MKLRMRTDYSIEGCWTRKGSGKSPISPKTIPKNIHSNPFVQMWFASASILLWKMNDTSLKNCAFHHGKRQFLSMAHMRILSTVTKFEWIFRFTDFKSADLNWVTRLVVCAIDTMKLVHLHVGYSGFWWVIFFQTTDQRLSECSEKCLNLCCSTNSTLIEMNE